MSDSPKKTFGKYEAISHLGSGAMGVVWRARDPVLGRIVAVKTISAALGSDNDNKERFLREAQAAAQLNHPNIITVFDFGQADNELYMAMELLEGKDLKELISGGQLTFDEKLDIMEQVADGLAYAHGRNVIHRDLKPGNMHVQPNGQVKILDFGLARLGNSDLTKTGVIMGTPNYMSPEQVLGERVDARSDVFSAGGVFYELLTNRKPFDSDSVHATLYQVVHRDPPPPRQWNPDLPDAVVRIVETAMAKQVENRYPNAAAFRDAIRAFRYGEAPPVLTPREISDNPLAALTEGETTAISRSPPTLTGSAKSKPGSFRSFGRGGRGSAASESHPGNSSAVPHDSGSRFRSGSRPRLRPESDSQDVSSFVPPPPRESTNPLLILGVIAIVVVVAGAAFVGYRLLNQPPVANQNDALLKARTANLVETQIDLAGRLLADKNYARALQQTAATLELDPGNIEALGIRDQAQTAIRQIEQSVANAQQAVARGDSEQASAAVQRVLALDPTNPVVAQLSGQLNSNFAARATDARSQMEKAKTQARAKAGADKEAAFSEGERLAASAVQALQERQFTTATQTYLQASDAYDRARRAIEGKERDAERLQRTQSPPTPPRPRPTPPPDVALATPAPTPVVEATPATVGPTPTPRVIVLRPVAPSPVPTARPLATPVPTPLPRATPVSTPPPTPLPTVAPPPPEARTFTASRMKMTAAPGAKQTPFGPLIEFTGKCEFEVTPNPLIPGAPFQAQLFVRNDSQNNTKIESLTVKISRNGENSTATARMREDDVKIAQRPLVAEIPGTWVAGTTTWAMEVNALTKKGERFSCSLTMNKP